MPAAGAGTGVALDAVDTSTYKITLGRKVSWLMNSNYLKTLAIAAVTVPLYGFLLIDTGSVPTFAAEDFDAAATYKAKCAMCHKPTAEKAFDMAKADDVLVQAILTGVKAEKPPNMPGYAEKGMTEEQAKALVAHMRSLREAPAK